MSTFFDNFSESEFENVIMAISDIIASNKGRECSSGLYVGDNWLTPFQCYCLHRFLSVKRGSCLVDDSVLELLRLGTNHPETLLKV